MKLHSPILLICLSAISGTALADSAKAVINWANVSQLGLPVSGLVQQINVTAGQIVEKNTPMLTLDCTYYQAQAQEAKVLTEGLKPGLDRAAKDRDLADELFERTVLSVVEHEEAVTKFIEIKSRYDAALAKQTQANWKKDHCAITASDKLIVLSVKVAAGQMVNLNTSEPALLSVASAEKVAVAVNVKAADSKAYPIGKSVKVTIAGQQYAGKISAIHYTGGTNGYSSANDAASTQLMIEVNGFNPAWIGTEATITGI